MTIIPACFHLVSTNHLHTFVKSFRGDLIAMYYILRNMGFVIICLSCKVVYAHSPK